MVSRAEYADLQRELESQMGIGSRIERNWLAEISENLEHAGMNNGCPNFLLIFCWCPNFLLLRMLGALHTIGSLTDSVTRKQILVLHAQCIAETAEQSLKSHSDRELFDERYARVIESFQGSQGVGQR